MACTCLDCYVAVVHPITYHKKRGLTPRVVMAAIVWALAIANGMSFYQFYCLFFTMLPAVPYIITIVTIGICDFLILHTLVKSDTGRKSIHPQKQRAIQTLVDSLVMTVLSYLPPVMLYVIGTSVFCNFGKFICYIGIPSTIISSSGSAIMPLLHLYHRGKLDGLCPGCVRNS
ncbi:unnamed protein product [Xyrichtys novacula]|uniref:Unnamed protein product n=1 Tax=Xyrichtys novacula TaxID=13765 RepID=A0AAV1H8L3_XYRNO|nr:unnamed protein product [Xyrichtys novacula]